LSTNIKEHHLIINTAAAVINQQVAALKNLLWQALMHLKNVLSN
jgi:hypothetical protein